MSAGGSPRAATRRRVIATLSAGAFAVASARAQTRTGPRRIGALWPGVLSTVGLGPARDAFLDRLRERGWVEGRTIEIVERFAEGRLDRLPEFARELVALRVEVIVAGALVATEAARGATATIPIVMIHAGGVESGLFQTLARPGGNVTGTVSMSPDLAAKQVELLHQLVPAARRVALLANPLNAGVREVIANALAAGRILGLEITTFEVTKVDEVPPTLAKIGEARPDALLVAADPVTAQSRAAVIEFAARAKLPAVYGLTWMVRDGGLVSYAANFDVLYPRAADYVDKILRGAKPAELPVEQPTVFELAVNLRTARTLGIEIPAIILARADEIIE